MAAPSTVQETTDRFLLAFTKSYSTNGTEHIYGVQCNTRHHVDWIYCIDPRQPNSLEAGLRTIERRQCSCNDSFRRPLTSSCTESIHEVPTQLLPIPPRYTTPLSPLESLSHRRGFPEVNFFNIDSNEVAKMSNGKRRLT